MVFYSIKVGTYNLKYSPLSDGKDEKYPVCDKDKNVLEYVKGTRTTGYYVNTKMEKVETTFMLVGDKALEKFERTKETDTFKIVESNEVENLVNPKQYIVECDTLKAELKESDKALKFGISFGGKSKPYYAIVRLNTIYNILEMSISKEVKQEQYLEYATNLNDKEKLKQITLSITGLDKARVEDLITL